MDHQDMAAAYFDEGFSCSQAVLLAFQDEIGLTREQAAKLAAPFGGGIARLRETCGAVSALFMAAGLVDGYTEANQTEEKQALYERIRSLADAFCAEHGSINCGVLLENTPHTNAPAPPEPRTDAYRAVRPCTEFVRTAARLLDEYIENRQAE